MNDFVDFTAGSGTFAPRKRQAYASKRLQQVVSDFRTKQAKLKEKPEQDGSQDSESGNDADEGPAKKKAKRRNAKSTRGGKKVQKTRGSNADSEKIAHGVSSSGEEYRGENVTIEEPLRVQLRPRPKPAYK